MYVFVITESTALEAAPPYRLEECHTWGLRVDLIEAAAVSKKLNRSTRQAESGIRAHGPITPQDCPRLPTEQLATARDASVCLAEHPLRPGRVGVSHGLFTRSWLS